MKKTAFTLLFAAVAAVGPGDVSAQTTLKIDSWLAPTNGHNAVVFPTWAKAVEDATQGRVKVTISYPPNVNPATFFDRLVDGISDVVWSFHGYNPGRFVVTRIVELPGLDATAYEASVAYQRVQTKYLDKSGEHDGIKLLTVFSHGPGMLHTREPISKLDQFKGLKVRNGGGMSGEVSNLLNFIAVPAPANKVYEIISQGVATGTLMPIQAKDDFKLKEVAPYTLIYPGGFYYGSFFIGMNKAKFDKLPKADQDAIDKVSGVALAEVTGKSWRASDENGLKEARAANNPINVASPELAKEIRDRLSNLERDWIEAASKKGVNARAALDELRAEVQKLKKS
jgi:TRAP-type C4-dicarboxylate transport system substrate-binding protein